MITDRETSFDRRGAASALPEPLNADFKNDITASFAQLALMQTIGARLLRVASGEVEIELPFRADLTQQHGFIAAAVVSAILDVACGYAAMSLMPPGANVLTVEFKVNLLAPAVGERLVARARVARSGRTLSVCSGDAVAVNGGEEKLVATMLATMMSAETSANVSLD
jgi:uncharacterized protein (TIGR00369 family)